MAKVIIKGWLEGLEKVSLTKLQMNLLGKSLKESKSNVDAILDDIEVIIVIDDKNLANEFHEKAKKLGALSVLYLK